MTIVACNAAIPLQRRRTSCIPAGALFWILERTHNGVLAHACQAGRVYGAADGLAHLLHAVTRARRHSLCLFAVAMRNDLRGGFLGCARDVGCAGRDSET